MSFLFASIVFLPDTVARKKLRRSKSSVRLSDLLLSSRIHKHTCTCAEVKLYKENIFL